MSDRTTDGQAFGIHLCDDLMFSSKVGGTARDKGFAMKTVRTMADLENLASQPGLQCVILDLGNATLNLASAVPKLKGLYPKLTVVGYGSHVDTETLQKAKKAGCDFVFPRSQFVKEIVQSMERWFGESQHSTHAQENHLK